MKKRYFIVFFQGWKDGKQKTCNASFYCNGFFNHTRFFEWLNEKEKQFDNIVVTGFNEVSEKDYITWNEN